MAASPTIPARPWSIAFAILLVLAALLPAAAQEVVDKARFWHKTDGPYDLTVKMMPAEPEFGVARYEVTVLDPTAGQPVLDAEVRVLATSPDGKEQGWAIALPTGVPGTYAADVNLTTDGAWALSVNVNSGLGADFVGFSINVPTARHTDVGLMVYGLVLLFFAFGFWQLWREARKIKHRREADGEAPTMDRQGQQA